MVPMTCCSEFLELRDKDRKCPYGRAARSNTVILRCGLPKLVAFAVKPRLNGNFL